MCRLHAYTTTTTTETIAMNAQTNIQDDSERLARHVRSIADTLENPPLSDYDADGAELPDDAIQCDGSLSSPVMVHTYDCKVPAEEFACGEIEGGHAAGLYTYDEEDDAWTCTTTGQRWEGYADEFWHSDDGDLILGGEEVTNYGPMSGYDYLSDVLDIEYVIASDGSTCLGARILVSFGGPNIWINTRTNEVEGYWWGDTARASYNDEIGIAETIEELWGCK